MRGLLSNPELVRYVRAQLRPRRALAYAALCAVISLTIWFSVSEAASIRKAPAEEWGKGMLRIILWIQAAVLVVGGGTACLHSIHREKEMNTFDFQRVTRLTPLELALGKLFGAPATAYFAVLCLFPAAVVGAVVGRVRPSFFFAACAVILLGSVCAHAFAVVLSMQLERGGSSAAMLAFLLVLGLVSTPVYASFRIHQLSPFFATSLVDEISWQAVPDAGRDGVEAWVPPGFTDVFFGRPIHHVFVMIIVYLTILAWYLLAISRNIKRDPAVYELFSPVQSLGLVLYVNLLLVGFFHWRDSAPHADQATLLTLNLFLFFTLGLILMRRRDQLRRRLREIGNRATGWLAALWPAPYLLVGWTLMGLAVTAVARMQRIPNAPWNTGLALFMVAFLALWVVRDVLYLQWINLTRIRRPLVMGFLYLIVFYSCAGVLVGTLGFFREQGRSAVAAILIPGKVFELYPNVWLRDRASWLAALGVLALMPVLFAYLHRQKLRELLPAADAGMQSVSSIVKG